MDEHVDKCNRQPRYQLTMITFNTESTHILVAVMVYIWEPPISVPPPNPNPLPSLTFNGTPSWNRDKINTYRTIVTRCVTELVGVYLN